MKVKNIFLIGLMVLAFSANAFAAIDINLQASDSVSSSSTFTVDVVLSGSETAGAATLRVNFDTTKVSMTEITSDLIAGPLLPNVDTANTNGYVGFGHADAVGFVGGTDTTIATLTFNPVATGDAEFVIDASSNIADVDIFAAVPDITGTRGTKTVSILANTPPVATDGLTITMDEDSSGTVTLAATDADGDTLTYSIVSGEGQAKGSVTLDGTTATYTATGNENGSDTFSFKVEDTSGGSDTASVSVTITPVNDDPIATNGTLTVNEDESGAGTLTASDLDGDALTYEISNQGSKGQAVISTGENYTYTPNLNENGTDSFAFTVTDAAGKTATATVDVTITAVNDAPTVEAGTLGVTIVGKSASGTVVGADVDGDALTYSVVAEGTHGTVGTIAADGTYAYTLKDTVTAVPDPATDTFTFKASDGNLDSADGTVTVTITLGNTAPVATEGIALTANEDEAGEVQLTATDEDNDTLIYSIVAVDGQQAKGTAAIKTGTTDTVVYTPNENANGTDSFTFKVEDGKGGEDTATVDVTITAVNDVPVAATDLALATDEDVAGSVMLSATDVDGDTLTYTLVDVDGQLARGSVTINGAIAIYTPTADKSGSDTFTFKADDGNGGTDTATVSVTINAVNDAPEATDGLTMTVTLSGKVATLGLSGTDADGDDLTYTVVSGAGPDKGTVTIEGSTATFTVKDGATIGTDSFSFQVDDGNGGTDTATVAVTVETGNLSPGATASSLIVKLGEIASGQLAGTDEDGTIVSYAIDKSDTTEGIVTLTDSAAGTFTYEPLRSTVVGDTDSFTFTVTDDMGAVSEPAMVSVTFEKENAVPTVSVSPTTLTVMVSERAIITVTADDEDDDTLTYSVSCTSGTGMVEPSTGTITGGRVFLTYSNTAEGTDVMTVTIDDGNGGTAMASVNITIDPEEETSDADVNRDFEIVLQELMRIQQIYSVGVYYSDADSVDGAVSINGMTYHDGYSVNGGEQSGTAHSADYKSDDGSLTPDWKINLSEFLRITQIYNLGGYCVASEIGQDDDEGDNLIPKGGPGCP